jgi:hypothetical protein
MTVKINADTTDGLKFVSDTSGAIDFQSNGITKMSMDSSGNITPTGIYLGGTGSANLLTDYEEGTFTPTLIERSGATQNTITDATFNTTFHGGSYTKIGNMVNVRGSFRTTSLGSFTSGYEFRIGGLPFSTPTTAAPYGEQRAVASICAFAGIDSIASDAYLMATISQGQDYLSFFAFDNSAGTSAPIDGVTNFQNDSYFNFSCTYRTEE